MRDYVKPLLGVVLAGLGSLLVFGFRTTDSGLPATAAVPGTKTPTTTNSSQPAPVAAATSAPTTQNSTTATQRATPTPTQDTSAGQFADGTYTGAAIREPWGTFEVEAVISGGQLVDVQLVAEPGDRHSSQINNVAVPLLTELAIASQGATIDMVSGATWTSESYAESLQAALDAAAAHALTNQVTS